MACKQTSEAQIWSVYLDKDASGEWRIVSILVGQLVAVWKTLAVSTFRPRARNGYYFDFDYGWPFCKWNLETSSPRSDNLVQLHIFFTTLVLTEAEDQYEWVVNNKPSTRYNTNEIYRELRGSEAAVPWASIVWFGGGIPRHNFLTWLFVLNRCPTRDRIASWGLEMDGSCLFYNQAVESRDQKMPLGLEILGRDLQMMQTATISILGSESDSSTESPWKQDSKETYFDLLAIDNLLGVAGEKQEAP